MIPELYLYTIFVRPTLRKLTTTKKREIISQHPSCVYCGSVCGELCVDHIYPLALGGLDVKNNFTVSCKRCNSLKSFMPIEEFLHFVLLKREKLFNQVFCYTYLLRKLRRKEYFLYYHLYTLRGVEEKINNIRVNHSYLTKIIGSLLNQEYIIFN